MALSQTDPELLRQLDEARSSGDAVQAVVKLQRTPGKAPVPAVVEEQTRKAVDRASKTTGEQPTDVHVLGRLATAYVSGSENFLREFIEQPEVASAVANQSSPAAGLAPGTSGGVTPSASRGVAPSASGGTAGGPPSGAARSMPQRSLTGD